MFHRLSEPVGKAGLIVAILALLAALAGNAQAATNSAVRPVPRRRGRRRQQQGLNNKQKGEVRKLAKKYAGARGPAGAPGNPIWVEPRAKDLPMYVYFRTGRASSSTWR